MSGIDMIEVKQALPTTVEISRQEQEKSEKNDTRNTQQTTPNEEIKMHDSSNMQNQPTFADNKQPMPSLIVNYLPATITEEDMHTLFSIVGRVTRVKIVRDCFGQSLGFGFVHYETADEVYRAMKELNGYPLGNKILKVSISRQRNAGTVNRSNLYIKNFPPTFTVERLIALMQPFGLLVEAKVLMQNGRCTGVGFARFDQTSSASAAIKNLNGLVLEDAIPGTKLLVKYADSNREKQAKSLQRATTRWQYELTLEQAQSHQQQLHYQQQLNEQHFQHLAAHQMQQALVWPTVAAAQASLSGNTNGSVPLHHHNPSLLGLSPSMLPMSPVLSSASGSPMMAYVNMNQLAFEPLPQAYSAAYSSDDLYGADVLTNISPSFQSQTSDHSVISR